MCHTNLNQPPCSDAHSIVHRALVCP
jgi:hypothetical protein